MYLIFALNKTTFYIYHPMPNSNSYKYISTTLPYVNSHPHMGHCFEFVLADVIASYHRICLGINVIFNTGIDEHGQKVYQKATELGFKNTQEYVDLMAANWYGFMNALCMHYTKFYRTTSQQHKKNVLQYYNALKIGGSIYTKEYTGNYCTGCEAFITDKDKTSESYCHVHGTPLQKMHEINQFFSLNKYSDKINNNLIDKSKSIELANLLQEDFDISITRQNVPWGIKCESDNTNEVFYVWFEALLNYVFSAGYYQDIAGEDKLQYLRYWQNSIIICGKDNLKFQAYVLPALLIANGIEPPTQVLVHGNILDSAGNKMSKSQGNVIEPMQQINDYGVDAVRYYLAYKCNTFIDSKYDENELVNAWNNDIVNGLGNLISRLLHLIDIRNVDVQHNEPKISSEARDEIAKNKTHINKLFSECNLKAIGNYLNQCVNRLNAYITSTKPYDKNCQDYERILRDVYFQLYAIVPFYTIVLKKHAPQILSAFTKNKKTIIFNKIALATH